MGIVFSKVSGMNDERWKPIGQVLQSVMMDTDTEKNKYDDFIKSVYNVKKSNKYAEKIGTVTSLANYSIVGEGEPAPVNDIQQGYSKLLEHVPFMNSFVCTREMKDDGDLDMMKTMASEMVASFKRASCEYATKALVTEGESFTFSGRTLDKTTGDKKGLFATDHKGKVSGVADQCNVYTNAFGANATMLNRLSNIGSNFKNQSGNVQNNTFDTIIIPSNCYELEDTIKRIIRSDLIVGSGNNDVNTQKGLWKLIVAPMWQVASGSPYILMSSEANKALNGSLFYNRLDLDVQNEVDFDTRNLKWNGYARLSAGFNDWRHVLLGGATAGTTLS